MTRSTNDPPLRSDDKGGRVSINFDRKKYKPRNEFQSLRAMRIDMAMLLSPIPESIEVLEVAQVAAILLRKGRDSQTACEQAIQLIRDAAAALDEARRKDLIAAQQLGQYSSSDAIAEILSAKLRELAGGEKLFCEKFWKDDSVMLGQCRPFPLSRAEFCRLVQLPKTQVYNNIDKSLRERIVSAGLNEEDVKKELKQERARLENEGIGLDFFWDLSKRWPRFGTAIRKILEDQIAAESDKNGKCIDENWGESDHQ